MASDDRFAHGQDIRDRTSEFAGRVAALCEKLYARGGIGGRLSTQLAKAATSGASMLEEARAAESTRDFISKCSISLKELRESHARLKFYTYLDLGAAMTEVRTLHEEAGELVAIVTAIIRNKKANS